MFNFEWLIIPNRSYLNPKIMKKLTTLLVLFIAVKHSNATGYSGLNNDLVIIYGLLIGICVSIIGIRNGYLWFKNRNHKQNEEMEFYD